MTEIIETTVTILMHTHVLTHFTQGDNILMIMVEFKPRKLLVNIMEINTFSHPLCRYLPIW